MSFADRYGPWALVLGASEGTGRAFARKIAANGVPCILIARREAPLLALAEEILAESGVNCITATIDLAAPDGFDRILAAIGQREVGLFVSNAGADPNGSHFLDRDIRVWLEQIQRNVVTMTRCCHHLGGLMRKRRKGGLLLVNSGACYGGSSFMATYSATKAFTLCFGESLWAELRHDGVDVLTLIMSTTDTPMLRALLETNGLPLPASAADAAAVAEMGLARLPHGPVHNWGFEDGAAAFALLSAADRRKRVLVVEASSAKVFGKSSGRR
jgi:short-subunit dehydrogenase